jgi:hypothetical protein
MRLCSACLRPAARYSSPGLGLPVHAAVRDAFRRLGGAEVDADERATLPRQAVIRARASARTKYVLEADDRAGFPVLVRLHAEALRTVAGVGFARTLGRPAVAKLAVRETTREAVVSFSTHRRCGERRGSQTCQHGSRPRDSRPGADALQHPPSGDPSPLFHPGKHGGRGSLDASFDKGNFPTLGIKASFGVMARPVGAYVIRGDQVEWRPAIDTGRLAMAGLVLAGLAVFTVRTAIKARAKKGRP